MLIMSTGFTSEGAACAVMRTFFCEVGVKKLSRDRFLDILALIAKEMGRFLALL